MGFEFKSDRAEWFTDENGFKGGRVQHPRMPNTAAPITVRIIKDSITDGGSRLVTWCWDYWRAIHSEVMTHRALSRNAASSRAIPAGSLRRRVSNAPFVPFYWGKNQKGMQADQELTPDEIREAEDWWLAAMFEAVGEHEDGEAKGIHKQIVNRVIEPWMTISVVVSATDHANLFSLRKHGAAEPHFQCIAGLAWELFHTSMPTYVPIGGWHLPYVGPADRDWSLLESVKKLSVGRCARVSYLTHDGKRDPQEDIRLHDQLANTAALGADPMHACYDAATEVLTDTGWVPWPQISHDMRLAEARRDGTILFAKPVRLVADPFDGAMYSVRGQQLDLVVTPNHKMLVGFRDKHNNWSDFDLVAAEDLGERPCRYLKSGFLQNRRPIVSPWGFDQAAWMRFLGFFVGDGHAPREGGNQAQFHLRKERKQEFVRQLGLPWRQLADDRFVIELPGLGHWLRETCYASDDSKQLPNGCLLIDYEAANALFDGLRNSDGSKRRRTWVYATTSAVLRDQLQAILHLNGLVGGVTTTSDPSRRDSFRINVSRRTTPRVEVNQTGRALSYEIGRVPYKGIVYCAKTESGALLVRRNGHVVISGNSPFEHPAQAVGFRQRIGNFEGWKQYRKFFPTENGPSTDDRCLHCGCWAGRHVKGCRADFTP